MFTYLNRMRDKSGFTLVELIIVISIIAIMAAVAVPNFISSQRRAEGNRQNEHARGFYFAVQSTLLNTMEDDNTESEFFLTYNGVTRRRSSPIGNAPPIKPIADQSENFYIFGQIGTDGKFSSADLLWNGISASNAIANFPIGAGLPNDGIFRSMLDEIEGYMANDGEVGYYYAMFDSQFRVTMAYYSKFTTAAGNYTITRNNFANGQIFGAHPIQYSFFGNFVVPGNSASKTGSNWFTEIKTDAGANI